MIEEKYYKEFEYLKDTVYLDTASVAMQPDRTLRYCRGFQDEFVKERGRLCFDGTYQKRRAHTAELAAKLIHTDVSNIMFTPNTTSGNSLLVSSLKLEKGESVITTDIEYPAVLLGWAQKQSEGISLKLVNTDNGAFEAEQVIERMDDTTRVVSLSLVHNLTGFMPDIAKIGKACRERGIIFAVDAIQGLGRIPVDVEALGIDYLSCGGFKGLLGVFGVGFVYCSKALQPLLKHFVFSDDNILFQEGSGAGQKTLPVYAYKEGLQGFDAGSNSTCVISALGVSLEMLMEIGIDEIRRRILNLERIYRQTLKKLLPQVCFLGKDNEESWSGNIAILFDKEKTVQLEQALEEKKIITYVEKGYLRVSLHYFNTEAQMELAAETVAAALK